MEQTELQHDGQIAQKTINVKLEAVQKGYFVRLYDGAKGFIRVWILPDKHTEWFPATPEGIAAAIGVANKKQAARGKSGS